MSIDALLNSCIKDMDEHRKANRKFEEAVSTLHLSIFKTCTRKYDRSKHIDFVKRKFKEAEVLNRTYIEGGQTDDAYLQNCIMRAYQLFWIACGLPEKESKQDRKSWELI